MIVRMLMWGRRTDPKTATHSLREGIQMPQTNTRTTVLREREQLKCTW